MNASRRTTFGPWLIAGMAAVLLSACEASGNSSADAGAMSEPAAEPERSLPPEPVETTESHGSGQDSVVREASTDPSSIYVLVNPLNPVQPKDHRPEDLVDASVETLPSRVLVRGEVDEAMQEMFGAAAEAGLELELASGYRGFDSQQSLYEQRVEGYGVEEADAYVARPGHSEHQTGLAIDIQARDSPHCDSIRCFGETPHGEWTAENASDFGFIVRYPHGAEAITGYSPEPWHLRYIGRPTAQAVSDAGVTLEEFWGEPPAPDYAD
ncbi:M15 family metallopeptidase [Nesterenkonia aerolata]|uniref:M15 family metallopeptidase n=1 Tax=Nesterenkonia aerolata TaxID=3074079 RepID=A0ABU2DUZ7_9MICC|nr:M15 family metallopeptidase [Nesterenkonia sp. LY-0111]MDR8020201.1 M15 family metallopeptidase [Nesterenkonia sp. LY-0111]